MEKDRLYWIEKGGRSNLNNKDFHWLISELKLFKSLFNKENEVPDFLIGKPKLNPNYDPNESVEDEDEI
jgi:hypothetical protein